MSYSPTIEETVSWINRKLETIDFFICVPKNYFPIPHKLSWNPSYYLEEAYGTDKHIYSYTADENKRAIVTDSDLTVFIKSDNLSEIRFKIDLFHISQFQTHFYKEGNCFYWDFITSSSGVKRYEQYFKKWFQKERLIETKFNRLRLFNYGTRGQVGFEDNMKKIENAFNHLITSIKNKEGDSWF